MKPFVLVFVMALAALVLASAPKAEAHYPNWAYQLSCGYYSATLTLSKDNLSDAGPHRLIITKNNVVVARQDYPTIGTGMVYSVAGRLPIYATYTAYVYDKVNGSYVYSPAVGSYFAGGSSGLHSSTSLILASKYWCSSWYLTSWR